MGEKDRGFVERRSDNSMLSSYVERLESTVREQQQIIESLKGSGDSNFNYNEKVISVADRWPFDFFIIDKDGKYRLQNRSARTNWGDLTGKRISDLHIDSRKIREIEEHNKRAFKGEIVEEETEIEVDGAKKTFYNIISPIYSEDKIEEISEISIDISSYKKWMKETQNTSKLESLANYTDRIVHDFKNMLTGVMGNLTMIKLVAKGRSDILKYVQNAEDAAKRANNLTNQLQIFAGNIEPSKKLMKLDDFIVNAVKLELANSQIVPHFSIDRDHYDVEIDPSQLSQVIHNIIKNAIEAMDGSGVVNVSLSNVTGKNRNYKLVHGANKYFVKITITDHGQGVEDIFLDKLYDPYFTTRKGHSGLGLTICQSIINKHDGYIEFESTKLKGASVHIFLPAHKSVQTSKEMSREVHKGTGRVLVMDDDPIVSSVVNSFLVNLGYVPVIAKNGFEALERYSESFDNGDIFDVVILDLTVPGSMGGLECLRQLRQIDPEVKAIVASGYSNDPVLSNFSDYGFKGKVSKPFTIYEISEEVKRVVTQ